MAVPKKKKSKAKGRSHQAGGLASGPAAAQRVPALPGAKTPHVVCPSCGWYKGRQAVEVD